MNRIPNAPHLQLLALSILALTFVRAGVDLTAAAEIRPRAFTLFTHFESFENALENTAQDPRDQNRNGIIDCGRDNDCSTVTVCRGRGFMTCDEWTLPLEADPDLRLVNEDHSGNKISFKSSSGAVYPSSRGFGGIVAPGSLEVCPHPEGAEPLGIRADLFDWHIHTERTSDIDGSDISRPGTLPKAFRGRNSMHWGRHVQVPATTGQFGDAYCLQCMNEFVLDREGGLNLAEAGTPEQPPRLTFWHIAEFCDDECYAGFTADTADDFSIVEVRAAEPGTADFGVWERVVPVVNAYDGTEDTLYITPTYEPPDDRNPDSVENPLVTMCAPLTVYVAQGSSKGTDPTCSDPDGDGTTDCGNVTSGTALGEAGVGVWARAEFDLTRYAGRRIQIRWIPTTLDARGLFTSYLETITNSPFHPFAASFDDGWYIDDVRVSGLRR